MKDRNKISINFSGDPEKAKKILQDAKEAKKRVRENIKNDSLHEIPEWLDDMLKEE